MKIYDFGIDNDSLIPYLVLEYLEGSLLFDLPIYSMNKKFIRDIFSKVLSTLEYLHSSNNIMVLPTNEIKLFDFGISQYHENQDDLSFCFNKVKAYNLKYYAPEILLGKKPSF